MNTVTVAGCSVNDSRIFPSLVPDSVPVQHEDFLRPWGGDALIHVNARLP